MSDEKFFSQVKGTLENYTMEAPAEVYTAMRKKLWWSNFTKLSPSRFNMWYLILLLGISVSVMAYNSGGHAPAEAVTITPIKPKLAAPTEVAEPAIEKEVVVTPIEEEKSPEIAVERPTEKVEISGKSASKPTVKKLTNKIETPNPTSETNEAAAITTTETPREASQTEVAGKEENVKKKSKKLSLDIYIDENNTEPKANGN